MSYISEIHFVYLTSYIAYIAYFLYKNVVGWFNVIMIKNGIYEIES